jgi:hypothetical protein
VLILSIHLANADKSLGNRALSFSSHPLARINIMTAEFNELLPVSRDDAAQVWIIGTRDQVVHLMNEFYVRKLVSDRVKFTPIIPAPFAAGKVMTVLVR